MRLKEKLLGLSLLKGTQRHLGGGVQYPFSKDSDTKPRIHGPGSWFLVQANSTGRWIPSWQCLDVPSLEQVWHGQSGLGQGHHNHTVFPGIILRCDIKPYRVIVYRWGWITVVTWALEGENRGNISEELSEAQLWSEDPKGWTGKEGQRLHEKRCRNLKADGQRDTDTSGLSDREDIDTSEVRDKEGHSHLSTEGQRDRVTAEVRDMVTTKIRVREDHSYIWAEQHRDTQHIIISALKNKETQSLQVRDREEYTHTSELSNRETHSTQLWGTERHHLRGKRQGGTQLYKGWVTETVISVLKKKDIQSPQIWETVTSGLKDREGHCHLRKERQSSQCWGIESSQRWEIITSGLRDKERYSHLRVEGHSYLRGKYQEGHNHLSAEGQRRTQSL